MLAVLAAMSFLASCNRDTVSTDAAALVDASAVSPTDLRASTDGAATPPADLAAPGPDQACVAPCTAGSCPVGTECFAPETVPTATLKQAVCLRPCNDTSDCASPYRCVYLRYDEDLSKPHRRYCVTDGDPPVCAGVIAGNPGCLDQPTTCEASVALYDYEQRSGPTCGLEYVNCGDAGCTEKVGCN